MRPNRRLAPLVSAAAVTICLAASAPALALELNGWLPAAGQGDVALSYTAESWDEFWVGEMEVTEPALGTVDIESTTLWGRFGLSDDAALIFNLPYVSADGDGPAPFEGSDLQDATAMLLFRFASIEGDVVRHRFLAGAGVRTPASNYEANQPIDIGDGTTDVLTRFVYQVERGNFYGSQQIGYDLRSLDAPDNWSLYTELGLTTGRLTWIGYYHQVLATGGTDIGDPGFTFPSNEEEFQRAGLRVFTRLTDRFGLSLAGFTTLDGRNTAKSEGYSGGLVVGF